jgi:hypothetical protein
MSNEKKSMDTINPLLVSIVNEKLRDIVVGKKIFSAWDISKNLKNRYGDNEISHNDIRAIVEDWFKDIKKNSDEWCRTLINLTNGKVTYVYHPLTILAERYPSFKSLVDTYNDAKTKKDEKSKLTIALDENENFILKASNKPFVYPILREDYKQAYEAFRTAYESLFEIADDLFLAVEEFLTDGTKTLNRLTSDNISFEEKRDNIDTTLIKNLPKSLEE